MKKLILLIAFVLTLSACSNNSSPASSYVPQSKPGVVNPGLVIEGQPVQSTMAPTLSPVLSEIDESKRMDAKIVKVVDGDTMNISLDGKKETIRLLLIDTPETVHPTKPVEPFGPEASKFAHESLDGKDIQIEIDVSERDKYGRLLCYLWVGDKMFNEMILEKGLARVAYVIPPNIKYVDQFREIQKIAQNTAVGIWSIENYAQEDGFHDDAAKNEVPASEPSITPAPIEKEVITPDQNVYYQNCTAVRAAGKAPIHLGDPGYSKKLDRDGDGIACE